MIAQTNLSQISPELVAFIVFIVFLYAILSKLGDK
jgi:hypothetical protein